MKKRILSCLMALALCLTLLPTAALAEETEGTAETPPAMEEPTDPANGEAKQENQPAAPEQEGQPAEQEEQQEDSAAKQAVADVQAMIDALPDEVTADNADEVEAQLMAIDAALEDLTDDQLAKLDMTRFEALCATMTSLTAAQDDGHTHCICGKTHQAINGHETEESVTFATKLWMKGDQLMMGEGDAEKELTAAVVPSKGTSDGNPAKDQTCYTLPAGSYYLGTNLELAYPLYIPAGTDAVSNVYLCLNGKTIEAEGDFSAIILYRFSGYGGLNFTLTDCIDTGKITHAEGKTGSGVQMYSYYPAIFNLYGGTISGNTAENGGGVYMTGYATSSEDKSGILNLYGGTISGNTATGNGGGVYVYNVASKTPINLYGGTISGNTAANGGGVYMTNGTFTMTGGTIGGTETDDANTASGSGGGVYVNGGTFNLSGGTISGNTAANGGGVAMGTKYNYFHLSGGAAITNNTASTNGGGVYLPYGNGWFYLSGAPKITGNTKDSGQNNVYLADGMTLTIEDALTNGADIGVTTERTPSAGDAVKVAVGYTNSYDPAKDYTLTETDVGRFSIDAGSGYEFLKVGNSFVLRNNGDTTLHQHPYCGDKDCTKHPDKVWTPLGMNDTGAPAAGGSELKVSKQTSSEKWTSTEYYILRAGSYYLTGDLVLDKPLYINSSVNLDLNGCSIKVDSEYAAITVDGDTLTLCDCVGSGTITHEGSKTGRGVYVDRVGKFYLYGGTITGNTANGNGGGVFLYCNESSSAFYMYGGAITGNSASGDGGGVYVGTYSLSNGKGATFYLYGGTISGNTATKNGGGVCAASSLAKIYLCGGTIGGTETSDANKAALGGGIHTNGCTLRVYGTYGGVKVIGNAGSNVYIPDPGRFSIYVSAALEDTRIGITTNKDSTITDDTTTVTFAQVYSGSADWIKEGNFFPDNEFYKVTLSTTSSGYAVAFLAIHDHKWGVQTVEGSENVLRESCKVKGCGVTGGTLTLVAEDKGYDGTPYEATLQESDDWATSLVDSYITYAKKIDDTTWKKLSSAPTAAGDYRAKITVNGAEAQKTFTITAGTLTAGNFQFTPPTGDLTYDGDPKTAAVTPTTNVNEGEIGAITVYYEGADDTEYTKSTDAPRDAGTYKVSIDVAEGDAYNAATGLSGDGWTFAIAQADPDLYFKKTEATTTYGADSIQVSLVVPDEISSSVTYTSSNTNVAEVDSNGNASIKGAGETTITATFAGTQNYKADTAEYTLTVDPCSIEITGATVADKTYDANKTATVTGVTFAASDGLTGLSLPHDADYNVTAEFPDKDADDAEVDVTVTVTLLGDAAKNYKLASETYTAVAAAKIIPSTIQIGVNGIKEKTYDGTAAAEITGYTISGLVSGENLKQGEDFTVSGTFRNSSGDSEDPNAGENKPVYVTITLKDSVKNYRFADGKTGISYNTSGTINPVTTQIALTAESQTITKNGKPVDISGWASIDENTPRDADLTYELDGTYDGSITLTGTTLTADPTTEVTGFDIKVSAPATTNYTAAKETIHVNVVEKEDAGVVIEGLHVSKTYGDEDFHLTATKTAPDGGTWSWVSSDPDVLEIVSGADTATPTIRVKKADTTGRVTLTVTYSSDTHYDSATTMGINVNPKTVTADMIAAIPAQDYTGSAIQPTPEVKDGTATLTSGTDFTFSYDANADVADGGKVTITGQGNYTGTAYKTFEILPKSITGAEIALSVGNLTYTGREQCVYIASVSLDGWHQPFDYAIVNNSDRATDASDSITLTIEGRGNYTGTATTTWKILKADPTLADFDVTPALAAALTYDGRPKTVTVTAKSGVKGMGAVTVKYDGGTDVPANAGNYAVTIDVATGSNYNAVSGMEVGTLTIDKADPTVPSNLTGMLNQPLSTVKLPEGWTWDDRNTVMDAVGQRIFKASYTESTNYNAKTNVDVTVSVTDKETVTISGLTYANKTYDGKAIAPAGTLTVEGDKVPANELEVLYESTDNKGYSKTEAPKDAGAYKVTYKVADSNKDYTGSVTYGFIISPRKVTVAPADKTMTKGSAIPAFELTYKGLVAGDTLTPSVAPTFSCYEKDTTSVTTNTAAGTYTITWTNMADTTFDNGNYAVTTSATGTLTISNRSTGGGGGGSSSDRDSHDSNPVIKTETKNNTDGSTTKTETRRDGSVTQTTTGKDGSVSKTETKKDGSSVTENKAADGSTGTVKTDKNGQTEAKTALSNKAIEDAKKSGEAVKALVEVEASRNSSTAPTVSIELPKGAGETKVEIPVSNVKPGTVAVIVHPDGTEEIVKNSVPTKDGIQLTVDGNATVKIVDNSKGFIDIRNHWAEDAIDFVSARGLVNGMSDTIYAPNNSTTRAQLWTILARQNDADLSGGSVWYEKAQNWAKYEGVSDGANPNAAINRAQMVTMLWRAVGQPAPATAARFTDVPADAYYAGAVSWAVENGITTGIGNGRFDPTGACTRAQIAAFLARSMK